MLKKILAIIFALALLLSVFSVPALAADPIEENDTAEDTAVKNDDEDEESEGLSANQEITLGMVYQVMAFIATEFIEPQNFKALEGITVDIDNPENLLTYAKAIGLLTVNDTAQYRKNFKKDFDLTAPATRQEYAVIIERFLNILRINGIQFAIPKAVSSSTSVAKGSGNGNGTSTNIGGGNSGANLTIDYYKDYGDLAGYAQKAFSSALMIGFLDVKRYEETKTVKLKSLASIDKSYFLAPNDIITLSDIEHGFDVLMSLIDSQLTAFSRENLNLDRTAVSINSKNNVVSGENDEDEDAEDEDEDEEENGD